MALLDSPLIAGLGLALTVALFAVTYWDAARIEMSRPLLWATTVAGTVAVGLGMYLFTSAPLPGVIMTANTGSVLYKFERGETTEDDEPAEPGQLPHEPVRRRDGREADEAPDSSRTGYPRSAPESASADE
ncbi:hypothetical protein [Halopiger thermotolerans]